jgi:hypothetical protein
MKVWLDDVRPAPEGWHRCFWPSEVIKLLKEASVTELSLDHDLGDDAKGTGYDVLTYMEERARVHYENFNFPVRLHTANPVARARMQAALAAIHRVER